MLGFVVETIDHLRVFGAQRRDEHAPTAVNLFGPMQITFECMRKPNGPAQIHGESPHHVRVDAVRLVASPAGFERAFNVAAR